MTEKALEARREYRRKWQRENRDKVKSYNVRYWEKKALKAAAEREAAPPDTDTEAADE